VTEPDRRDDDRAHQLALFRYGVIAPLVELEQEPEESRRPIVEVVREVVSTTFHLPGQGPITVSERTVYAWLARFRGGGIDALRPKIRKDRGTRRVLDDAVLDRAERLRRENPKRFTKTVLDILELEKVLEGKPDFHRATLDRHLARRGASRRQLRVLGEKRTIKMQFESFGDLWVGDYHHGPIVLAPDGKHVTSKLGAFIDHTTRFPIADHYYLSEDLATLRDTLLRALLTWGKPKKVYVDRGAVYRSEQLAYSLQRIGTTLIHSRAYYSQGRGVIERWWQVADQFEAEVRQRETPPTIHELNSLWEAYRDRRYLRELHSELGKTPADAVAGVTPRPLDPAVARELFLVSETRTVHKKDGCVPVLARRFLCDSFLRDKKVTVRFDPNDLSSVLIYLDGKQLQRAFPQPINAKPEPHPEPTRLPPSTDYLGLVREEFDRKLLEQARPLAYAELRADPSFDRESFVKVVSGLAGLNLRVAERRELEAFWDTWGSVPEELARIGTEHAVRLHGRGRHPQVYLHAVRTLVLAHWRNPEKKDSK
jgi:transposase InsO family protein